MKDIEELSRCYDYIINDLCLKIGTNELNLEKSVTDTSKLTFFIGAEQYDIVSVSGNNTLWFMCNLDDIDHEGYIQHIPTEVCIEDIPIEYIFRILKCIYEVIDNIS